MRTRSLWAIAIVISIIAMFIIRAALAGLGIDIFRNLIAHLIALFVIAPIVLAVLTPFNNRLREARKARGRDIVAEERHESEDGMISLRPKGERE